MFCLFQVAKKSIEPSKTVSKLQTSTIVENHHAEKSNNEAEHEKTPNKDAEIIEINEHTNIAPAQRILQNKIDILNSEIIVLHNKRDIGLFTDEENNNLKKKKSELDILNKKLKERE